MAIYYNPHIVTNGMVLCLDAANKKCFNSFGVGNPRDLVRGLEFSIYNTDYVTWSNEHGGVFKIRREMPDVPEAGGGLTTTVPTELSPSVFLLNDHTVDIWFKPNDRRPSNYDNTEQASALFCYSGWHSGITFYLSTINYGIFHYDNTDVKWSGVAVTDYSEDQFIHLTVTVNNFYFSMYINGELKAGNQYVKYSDLTPMSSILRIGFALPSESIYSWHADIDFACLKMYNRALTAEEVYRNYIALRGRYGM